MVQLLLLMSCCRTSRSSQTKQKSVSLPPLKTASKERKQVPVTSSMGGAASCEEAPESGAGARAVTATVEFGKEGPRITQAHFYCAATGGAETVPDELLFSILANTVRVAGGTAAQETQRPQNKSQESPPRTGLPSPTGTLLLEKKQSTNAVQR